MASRQNATRTGQILNRNGVRCTYYYRDGVRRRLTLPRVLALGNCLTHTVYWTPYPGESKTSSNTLDTMIGAPKEDMPLGLDQAWPSKLLRGYS
jgi:hypothetical protein